MLELTVQELKKRLEKQELLTEEAMRIAKVAQNEIQEFKKRFITPTNSLTTNINLQDLLMLSDPPPLPEPLNYHPETPTFNKQLQSQSDFNGFPSTPTTPYQYCSPAAHHFPSTNRPIGESMYSQPNCFEIKAKRAKTKNQDLSSAKIDKAQLVPASDVINKYPNLQKENVIGKLAVKLAKESFFGDSVLVKCTVNLKVNFGPSV